MNAYRTAPAYVQKLVNAVIKREGDKYTNRKADRGGPTKYGITLETLQDYRRSQPHYSNNYECIPEDVMSLTISEAQNIYTSEFYYRPQIDKLPDPIRELVFDGGVNHGPALMIKQVQQVIKEAGIADIKDDGVIGPVTVAGCRKALRLMGNYFINAIVEERKMIYDDLVHNDRDQIENYNGWMNRLEEFRV